MISSDIKRLAIDFIRSYPLGILCTVAEGSKPWGGAVYVGSDNDFNLYFTTKTSTAKHANLMGNHDISLVFVNEADQETLQLQGKAVLAEDNERVNAATDALRRVTAKTKDWTLPVVKLNTGGYLLYKVTVTYARFTAYGDKRKGEQPSRLEYRPDNLETSL